MKTTQKVFSLSKNKKNELIFEFSLSNISIRGGIKRLIKILLSFIVWFFIPIFSFFDFLAQKKQLVLASVGLGIGLGLSVLISQRPDALFAFPHSATNSLVISVARLTIPGIDLSVPVGLGNVQELVHTFSDSGIIHDERTSGLENQGVVVLTEVGFSGVLDNLESVGIGDEIVLEGSNTAKYIFRVTEIRNMEAEYLPNVIGLYDDAVVIYKPLDLFRSQLYIVIAQPV